MNDTQEHAAAGAPSAQGLTSESDIELAARLAVGREQILTQLAKQIVGQEEVLGQVLMTLFVGGNSILTGVPGLAKTLIVQTVAEILDLEFSRIQFTPDLMPSDITGTDIIQEDQDTGRREMVFMPGPIFAQILLADEINRTPPKTQAALLEAMQEHRVTVQGRTYDLKEPFFVFATQNPIELEGTYPLPEAQLDRFMFNIVIDHLDEDEEMEIVDATTTVREFTLETHVTGADLRAFHRLVRRVPIADPILRYAVHLVRMTRPGNPEAPDFVNKWVQYGASVRAAQFMVLGAKAKALMDGRYHVAHEDVRSLAGPVMRHRILTNFHAESERVTTDEIVSRLLELAPVTASGMS